MRIISGIYGGRKLAAPPQNDRRTKPMGERIRGAIFNQLIADLPGAVVLDAFAGTGALGIEALSRGARHATLIENNHAAIRLIRQNLQDLTIGDEQALLIPTTVHNFLTSDQANQTYDLIFADPPYHNLQIGSLKLLPGKLKPGGKLVLSLPKQQAALDLAPLELVSDRTYADARIAIYQQSSC